MRLRRTIRPSSTGQIYRSTDSSASIVTKLKLIGLSQQWVGEAQLKERLQTTPEETRFVSSL